MTFIKQPLNQNKMTPEEKAKYLVYKYYNEMNPNAPDCNISLAQAKQCALIAVDEILDNFGLVCNGQTFYTEHRAFDYYSEVKHELNKSQ